MNSLTKRTISNIGESWYEVIGEEFTKPYMRDLANKIAVEYKFRKIFPSSDRIFRAFRETPHYNVKVVVIGQDPYIHEGEADGLAFSSLLHLTPSLSQIVSSFDLLNEDLRLEDRTGDLSYLAKQGVLLLNRVLTVRSGASGSHSGIGWETFTTAVIQTLNREDKKYVFMLWGSKAQVVSQYITNKNHLVLEAEHPAAACYEHRNWYHDNCFLKANIFLENNGKKTINW